jgi:diguanylate cyclase (GGDEF)-like protein
MRKPLSLVSNPGNVSENSADCAGPDVDYDRGTAARVAYTDDLLDYWGLVIDRLKTIHEPVAITTPDAGQRRTPQDPEAPGRPEVQDFVAIVEQMYADLKRTLAQCRQLDQQISEIRAELASTHNELTSIQASERRARHQAQHDSLTKLPNARFFRERLHQALTQASQQAFPVVVMYLDLDGFKKINDSNGHEAGDALLRVVAARLARAVRAEDVVSRLGGDEFGCLFPHLQPRRKQLDRIALKLYEAVSAPCRIGSDSLTIRPSIGIATYPVDGKSARTLLKHADSAMYRAKASQVRYEYFNPDAYA